MGRVRDRAAAVVTTVAFVACVGMAATIALAASAAPALAASKGTDTVTAEAAPGSRLAPKAHYYRIVASAGSSITQTVHLENRNKHAIDVQIAGLDGFTSNATGAAYTTPNHAATHTGTWIVVSTPELTLQANESRDVNFTVDIPKSATPGEYLGAIGMWVPLASSTTTVPGGRQAGFAVTLQGERVIAVEIDIPGPAQASLAVTGVKPSTSPNGLVLQIGIANTGNAFTKGSGVVTVGDTKLDYPFQIDTFVSHTAIVYGVPWTRSVVPGSHQVSIKLTYAGGKVTTWNGNVVIAGALQRRLQTALHHTEVGAPAAGHRWSSQLLVGGVLAALACAAGAMWLRRRSRSLILAD